MHIENVVEYMKRWHAITEIFCTLSNFRTLFDKKLSYELKSCE